MQLGSYLRVSIRDQRQRAPNQEGLKLRIASCNPMPEAQRCRGTQSAPDVP